MQLQWNRLSSQERRSRVDRSAEGLAVLAHQEPVPEQGGQAHTGRRQQDVADAGVDVVRQRSTTS